METKTFRVEGMKCVHCKSHVEDSIKALDGVTSAEASVEKHEVTVSYDDSKVSPEAIKSAVDASNRYELIL